MPEELYDVKGSEHLEHEHGERFRGWYLTRTFLRTETIPLDYEELSYNFKVFDYNFKFIMPSKIEFIGGIISYSDAERQLGVFRFPQDEEGGFTSPLSAMEIKEQFNRLSEEDILKLVRNRKVLTFEAFRIPQHGFEFFGLSRDDEKSIVELINREFFDKMKKQYDCELIKKIKEVKEKISSSANYLLILQNVLDQHWKNLGEVSKATHNIIWI